MIYNVIKNILEGGGGQGEFAPERKDGRTDGHTEVHIEVVPT